MGTILKHPFDNSLLFSKLAEACRDACAEVVLDPSVRIEDLSVSSDYSPRFDSYKGYPQFFVSVRTNDASMLRGAVGFKGSYKERVEAVLNQLVKNWMPDARAYLEIIGPETGTVERLIPVASMIESGNIAKSAPIVVTAKSYEIPYLQIRGRHLIGPNPALATYLENLAKNEPQRCKRVIDMFGGTGITAKVLTAHANPELVVLLDNDPTKTESMRTYIGCPRVQIKDGDANTLSLSEPFDLVIADPYYEDVSEFLDLQLDAISRIAATLVFIPGNIENRVWNRGVAARIEGAGFRVTTHTLFGQVILEAQHTQVFRRVSRPATLTR